MRFVLAGFSPGTLVNYAQYHVFVLHGGSIWGTLSVNVCYFSFC